MSTKLKKGKIKPTGKGKTSNNNVLNDNGFVFLDDNNRPFLCRMWGGNPWLFYWHEGQKSWVTHTPVNTSNVMLYYEKALDDDQANLYHDLHKKFENRINF